MLRWYIAWATRDTLRGERVAVDWGMIRRRACQHSMCRTALARRTRSLTGHSNAAEREHAACIDVALSPALEDPGRVTGVVPDT